MTQEIKKLGSIKLLLLTVNGQEPRFDLGTKLLIKTFEQSFGDRIWDHLSVVYTRWGFSDADKRKRKMQKLTEDARRAEVITWLNSEYPNSKGKSIEVYFTDTFEINNDRTDETSIALK